MPKVLGDALIRVRPDADNFGNELDQQTGSAGTTAGKSFASKFATVAKVGLVVGVGAAITRVASFIAESNAGYADHLKIAAVTKQVIKTTGGAAQISARQVESLADRVERLTGVDGDAIQGGENLLLTFTNIHNAAGRGNKIFTRATGLLADMSVALGQDAKGSAIQLGKALNDPIKGVTALSRVGVSFTDQQTKQIKKLVESGKTLQAQKVILHELGKEFGGAAKAAATPADRARVAYHQLQDEVGSVTVPVMNKLSAVFADKIAPVLLRLAHAVLPPLRRGLLQLLDGFNPPKIKTSAAAFGGIETSLAGVSAALKRTDWSGFRANFQKVGDAIGRVDFAALKDSLGKGLSDSVNVFAVVLGFAADHIDTLAKYLPLLIGAFIAYKSAQAAANLAAVAALPLELARVVSNIALTRAMKAQTSATIQSVAAIASQTIVTGSNNVVIVQNTIEQGANNAQQKAGILTRLRSVAATVAHTVATVASTVAQKAAAAATRIWAAGQWLLNAAMTANPIGLVVAAIALLVGGIILAYKKSETFRGIVNGLWNNVLKPFGSWIGGTLVGFLKTLAKMWLTMAAFGIRAFAMLVKAAFGAFHGILTAAAKGLGWIPGLGDKIRGAQADFDRFGGRVVDNLNRGAAKLDEFKRKLDGATGDRTVHISVITDRYQIDHSTAGGHEAPHRAGGGPVSRGRSYLVGEHGRPEMFTPTENGFITANHQLARVGSSSGGPLSEGDIGRLAAAVYRAARDGIAERNTSAYARMRAGA